jgi:hypothetical protein
MTRAAALAGAVVGLCCALTVGCTLKATPPDDGGTDAGPAQTVGDQCTAIFTEFCMQAISRCGYTTPLDQCISSYLPTCCTGSSCNVTSQSPASAVDACKQALDAEGCYPISLNTTPPECQGIPKKP